jgi:uncharacterized protein (TIGR00730 family)
MKRLCVYCGSKAGVRDEYRIAAESFGRLLSERGIELVFGGGSIGVMGIRADAVLASGGRAIGVIPRCLSSKEVLHPNLTETIVVESMHERKARFEELADAFAALPGGLGTFEELFEILTWSQLGLHRKPVGVLNTAGYFDPLLAQIDLAIDEGFLNADHRELFIVETDPAVLLDRLPAHEPPEVRRWMDGGQI